MRTPRGLSEIHAGLAERKFASAPALTNTWRLNWMVIMLMTTLQWQRDCTCFDRMQTLARKKNCARYPCRERIGTRYMWSDFNSQNLRNGYDTTFSPVFQGMNPILDEDPWITDPIFWKGPTADSDMKREATRWPLHFSRKTSPAASSSGGSEERGNGQD